MQLICSKSWVLVAQQELKLSGKSWPVWEKESYRQTTWDIWKGFTIQSHKRCCLPDQQTTVNMRRALLPLQTGEIKASAFPVTTTRGSKDINVIPWRLTTPPVIYKKCGGFRVTSPCEKAWICCFLNILPSFIIWDLKHGNNDKVCVMKTSGSIWPSPKNIQ